MAFSQSATDHPTLKGNNSRSGVNGDVANSGPGFLRVQTALQSSSLRWFRPFVGTTPVTSLRLNEINPLKTLIDNTDFGSAVNLDASGNNVGPYDPLPNGNVAATGTWVSPLESEEAPFAYRVPIRRNQNPANAAPFNLRDPNPRFASHLWSPTTSSLGGVNQDPRQAIVPANLSTFSWVFRPRTSTLVGANYVVANDPTPKGYALYVWIPAGLVSPGGVARPRQRYWAYEITYGIGQRYVDVVDTEASGAGWVRLGNGGRPTNQLFQYAGLDGLSNPWPITIKLYNTIPRNSLDELTETVNGGSPDNRFAVFADAALFSAETDSYLATPTSAGFGTADVRVTGARNESIIDTTTIPSVTSTDFKAKPLTVTKGTVTSYDYNTGVERWRYSPLEESAQTVSFDNGNVRVIPTGGWITQADNPNARGGTYLSTPVNTVATTENVAVDPQTDLGDGSYEVYMYVGGNVTVPPINYATGAEYEVFEGGVSAGRFTIDLSGPAGWKRIGNRRYNHSVANPLVVRMENFSAVAADAGRNVYVDQFRFVGAVGTQVTSTPVHARAFVRQAPGVAPVETNVVIIADERGKLHCVDAAGNGDGTTTCYWTYPSSTTAANDPNLQPGQDPNDPNTAGIFQKFDGEVDTLQAQMPTDFDLSSAVVQRMTVNTPGGPTALDYLIIGSKNGRVYSIAMEGRGDFVAASRTPGTTFRRWTFPETYPATVPQPSQLGSIASVVTANLVIGGTPTDVVIIGTEQGRMYCLNAQGDFTYTSGNQLRTNIIWQYPPQNVQTLPGIVGAPTLDVVNNRLFFGTRAEDDNPARFMALDARTGAPLWGTTNNSVSDTLANPPAQLDWLSGSCYVSATQLNTLPTAAPTPMPDTVFAMNENGNVYAIDAATGTVIWRTNELQSGGVGSLIYTEIMTYGPTTVVGSYPVIMVPTDGGRFAALFARLGEETRFGNRQAWGYEMDSAIQASMTVSNKWLFGATTNGYLLAWSDNNNPGAFLPPGVNGPGNETATDNDPNYDAYRNCEVAYLSRAGFVSLRQTLTGSITGTQNYGTVIDNLLPFSKPYGKLRAPFRSTHGAAFEWGETIYVIAYNFPFSTVDTGGNDVQPPIIEATVTTQGRPGRPIASEARLFADKTSSDPDGGYAIFQIPLTAGGGTSQTPGPGAIRVQIRTSAVNSNNTQQAITLNPALSQLDYQVANPVGISVEPTFGSDQFSQLGYTNDPTREDSLLNGSQAVAVTGVGTVRGDLFGKSVGTAPHGGAKKTNIYVFDRSLITLLRGEGRGLDLIRVDRKDLRWQGGAATVSKPFAAIPGLGALMGNFEDLPGNFPNTSLDYPDVQREQVVVRKEPNGNTENPVFSTVSLKGPVAAGGGLVTELNASTRIIVPTVFEFQVNVPKYQPVNIGASSIPNQIGSFWEAGYTGRFTVYVDSDQSGVFGGALREAYRTFNLGAAVSPDERITIGTPNVDLGSLSAGAGYDSRLTYSAAFPYRTLSPTTFFNPYDTNPATNYSKMFKPFTAFNEGNMNLWNVRLAKGTRETSGLYWPWQVSSTGNNEDIWLDSATDVHSILDGRFAPTLAPGVNTVFAQKPRVGDSIGKQIKINPTSRLNPNLPGAGFPLVAGPVNVEPTIGVTPPLGMPVGRYSQLMRLIEDTGGTGPVAGASDESLSIGYTPSATVVPLEAYSDPTFVLTFAVKETRLTGGKSEYTASGFHEGNPVTQAFPAQWSDTQPSGLRQNSGNLVVSFTSNRPTFYPLAGNPNPNNRNTRIFYGAVQGGQLGAADSRGKDSSIRDLNKFLPSDSTNDRWFSGLASLPNVADATIFANNLTQGVTSPTDIGGTLTTDVSYSNPVWSTNGDKNLAGAVQSRMYVAYTGTAKRQTNSGVVDDSRIIITRLDPSGLAAGGTFTLDADPFSLKGRPTIVQNDNDLVVFYPALSNGVWSIYVTRFNESTGFTVPLMLQFGSGFESVSNPAIVQRNAQLNGVNTTEFDLTFTGRLRSSGVSEVFMARLDPNFVYRAFGRVNLATGQIEETAVYDSRFGAYRVRGAVWQGGDHQIILANGTAIFQPGLPTIDRQTRIESYKTIFGGRAIVDPNLGTIKFTGTPLPKNAQILVRYTPTFMRLSETGVAGYTSPSLLFDNRLDHSNTSTNYAFWKTPSGADEPTNSLNTFADRLVMTAVRSAAAGGQTSRPTMSTYRLGVRLGRTILTNPDGSLAEPLVVGGNAGSYQIDPAAGRIYFTRIDEDKIVTITLNGTPIQLPVTFIGETKEDFVSIENATNESNLYMFLDPVGTATNRRGMIWMLWSSTRSGAPSVFMQTVARKISPILPSN